MLNNIDTINQLPIIITMIHKAHISYPFLISKLYNGYCSKWLKGIVDAVVSTVLCEWHVANRICNTNTKNSLDNLIVQLEMPVTSICQFYVCGFSVPEFQEKAIHVANNAKHGSLSTL